MFPNGKDYEINRVYLFTSSQIQKYFEEVDDLFISKQFPPLSSLQDHFIFLRLMWAAVRMERFPKLQQWRYIQYEKALEVYLTGENLASFIKTYTVN